METVFNVLDFGACGDGKTDSTDSIQKALNEAAGCMGSVIVPPGRYLIRHLEMHGQGVSLIGTSAWSFRSPGASIFEACDPSVNSVIDITGAFGCSIKGISLTGKNLPETDHLIHGIYLYWDKYNGGKEEDTPSIDDCRIDSFSGDGIHLEHIWCFSVRHSMLTRNRNGLFIDGWDGFILDNWFTSNAGWGILGGNVVASITATGNRVEWNKTGGFKFSFGDSYNFTGNFFDRSHGPAIEFGGEGFVSLATLTGNIFRRSGACENPLVPEDSCHIKLKNCSNMVITGNTMRVGRNDGGGGILSPNFGIVASECHECIVKDNTMMNGALMELVVEQNNKNCLIENNLGTLADADTTTGSDLLN